MVLSCHNLAFYWVHSQLNKGQKREKRKFLHYFLLNIKVGFIYDLIYICQQNTMLEGRVTLVHLCLRWLIVDQQRTQEQASAAALFERFALF